MMSPSMQNLYDSIKNEPFKIPEDDGNDLTHTFFNPDREGWLLKLGMFSFYKQVVPLVDQICNSGFNETMRDLFIETLIKVEWNVLLSCWRSSCLFVFHGFDFRRYVSSHSPALMHRFAFWAAPAHHPVISVLPLAVCIHLPITVLLW